MSQALSQFSVDALFLPRGRSAQTGSYQDPERLKVVPSAQELQLTVKVLKFKSGESVFEPLSPVEGLYYVKSGVIKLSSKFTCSKGRLSQDDYLIDLIGEREFFGYQDLFLHGHHEYKATALKNTEIYLYPKDLVIKSLQEGGFLAEQILQSVAWQSKRKEERSKYQYLSSVGERIIQTLLELADKFGESCPEGVWLRLKLSRGELAQLAGTINESLSRHLGELKNEGLIEVSGKEILIKNSTALRSKVS
jgi:CRP/FNR family cyclic AMP-dependent transcriptional regulator